MGRENGTAYRKLQKVSNGLPFLILLGLVLDLGSNENFEDEDEGNDDYEGEMTL